MFAVLTEFSTGSAAPAAVPPPVTVVRMDDGALLIRHRDGDREAFAELVQRYRAAVYSYQFRCGVDAAARDDLFQEIFIKIHRAAPSFRADQPLKPWIFTIVANTVRSHFRSLRVRDIVAVEAEPDVAADPAADAQDFSEARETAVWLESAIQELPLAQREVLTLCCVEEMPQEQAAVALGLPINTVKTHLRRARLTLAQALTRRNARLRREVAS